MAKYHIQYLVHVSRLAKVEADSSEEAYSMYMNGSVGDSSEDAYVDECYADEPTYVQLID